MIRLLFIGDIVGRPGREIVLKQVPLLRRELAVNFVIANAENAAAGAGLTGALAKTLIDVGVDALTLGDHVWDQRGFDSEIGGLEWVCRPANLPAVCPGRDHLVVERNGFRLAILTVLGRQFMGPKVSCPFETASELCDRLRESGVADGCFVEIHAEATSEKQALGWFLDGRAVGVVGTHTHVPTADFTILPRGTAFGCDVGMTGPYASVLGREVEPVLQKFLDGMPRRFEVATSDVRLSAALIEYDPSTRRSARCELVVVRDGG